MLQEISSSWLQIPPLSDPASSEFLCLQTGFLDYTRLLGKKSFDREKESYWPSPTSLDQNASTALDRSMEISTRVGGHVEVQLATGLVHVFWGNLLIK